MYQKYEFTCLIDWGWKCRGWRGIYSDSRL